MEIYFILNNYIIFCAFLVMSVKIVHFLSYLISLEFMYLSFICAFCSLNFNTNFRVGFCIAIFVLGVAAIDAVIGFYYLILLYVQKSTLFLWGGLGLKG